MAATTKTWVDNNPPQVNDVDLNGFKQENNLLITSTGVALDTGNNNQTTQAISTYAAGGAYYTDSGAANAYALSPVGSKLAPTIYFEGMQISFVPGNTNTGASTINVAGLGIKALKDFTGGDLIPGILVAGEYVSAFYDGTDFKLITRIEVAQNAQQNVLIAGNFSQNPFQRGTIFSVDLASGDLYVADRVRCQNILATGVLGTSVISTGGPSVTQAGVFSPDGIRFSVTTDQAVIAATENSVIAFDIEGYDFVDIAQQFFTEEIWITSSINGVYCFSFNNAPPTDRSYVTEVNLSAGVLTRVDLIIPATPGLGNWNYTKGVGLSCNIVLAAGANFQTGSPDSWINGEFLSTANQVNLFGTPGATLDIWLPRVTPGQLTTPWANENFETNLSKCQRYYQKQYRLEDAPATPTGQNTFALYSPIASPVASPMIPFQTNMRDGPSVILYDIAGNTNSLRNNTTAANVTATSAGVRTNGFTIDLSAGGVNADDELLGFYAADAELF